MKYFLYSKEQQNRNTEMAHAIGKRYKVGKIRVGKTLEPYTELTTSPESIYTDFKVVATYEDLNDPSLYYEEPITN